MKHGQVSKTGKRTFQLATSSLPVAVLTTRGEVSRPAWSVKPMDWGERYVGRRVARGPRRRPLAGVSADEITSELSASIIGVCRQLPSHRSGDLEGGSGSTRHSILPHQHSLAIPQIPKDRQARSRSRH